MPEPRSLSNLVVIGSSAGGVEALSLLLSTLPEDFPAPVIVAQHLDPARESHLGEILGRKSTLPVRTVTDHEQLESGVVFVVPSNRHVNVTGTEIDLRVDTHGRPKPSIDLLLGSAAEVVGEHLIAVILTGTGSDGAAGAGVVKKAGGTVIIQNPRTAKYPGMPQSLAPNTVDIVAELDAIGEIIHGLLTSYPVPDEPDEQVALNALLEDVRERNGIDFSGYKTPTIMRRLQRRIVATGSTSIEGYADYVRERPEEFQHLVSSFLITVTEFFRDAELFEKLKDETVPELIEEARKQGNQGNQLRCWSAGCATGEEAYSLAILVAEALGDELGRFNVRIFATDLDEEAIAFARNGIYAHSALVNVPEALINRYFVKDDGNYQVNKLVRSMVIFGQHDLGQRSPFPRIDMVICRNVLIYFTSELQKRALQLFAYSLRNNGRLVLGKAESTGALSEYYVPENKHLKIYRRRGDRFLMPPALIESPATAPLKRDPSHHRGSRNLGLTPRDQEQQREDRVINRFLLRLSIGVVVVDRRYDIQLINNTARRLLDIHSPATGEDLIHLIHGAGYATLRAIIDAAFREDAPIEDAELAVEEPGTGELRHLRILAAPQHLVWGGQGSPQTVMLVLRDVTKLVQAHDSLQERLDSVETEFEQERLLNMRLSETNRQLDEGNQELTRINEELRTTNEELLLSTEEAQAATEEVETLNEELQATNEELETLNEELQATVEELNTTTDDLQARSQEMQILAKDGEEEVGRLEIILDSMDVGVLVVDTEGQETFTNASYVQMFGHDGLVCLDDDGEPLPPEASPQQRARHGEPFDMVFTCVTRDGARRKFDATGAPLRHEEEDDISGVILIREIKEHE